MLKFARHFGVELSALIFLDQTDNRTARSGRNQAGIRAEYLNRN